MNTLEMTKPERVAQSPITDHPAMTRADAERILAEVLAKIMKVPAVDVNSHFFNDLGADSMVMAQFCARVRKLSAFPPVSMKDVYRCPSIASLAAELAVETPAPAERAAQSPVADRAAMSRADAERTLAEVLAKIMKVPTVDVNSHFFNDLGADSMVMAHFCARIRKLSGFPPVSMKDIYRCPSIASLAANLAMETPTPAAAKVETKPETPAAPVAPAKASDFEFFLCGALQLIAAFVYLYALALASRQAYQFAAEGAGIFDAYVRSFMATSSVFAGLCLLPVVAKWALVGRWKRQQFRVWSLEYVRFWIVKSLIRTNPLVLFAGTPIYALYLRALGAKVGRNALIQSNHVPICTDLLTIGDNAVVRKDSFFNCYRAHNGLIETGPIALGKDSVVGEATVLDIDTSLGDGAQLGHSSSLYAGQSIPAGERRHGSPAMQRTAFDYRAPPAPKPSRLRKATYSAMTLLPVLLIAPLLFYCAVKLTQLLSVRPHFEAPGVMPLLHWTFYADALIASAALFFGSLLIGLAFVGTAPRLLNLALTPDKVYPLYGFHDWAYRTIRFVTNVRFFVHLFGDSSYIVYYLRWIGYDLSRVVQTGTNFGLEVKHDNPFMVTVGSGTMVADALSIINADYSSTSFRVSRARIGANSFLGNAIAYPAQSRAGDDCLLATKVRLPLEGDLREGTGLLGSPSFEIPRTVLRDKSLALGSDEVASRLKAKNRHNLATMGLFLLSRWFLAFVLICLSFQAGEAYGEVGAEFAALGVLCAAAFSLGYFILLDRLATGLKPLQPLQCSIYDPRFWSHERYWKLMMTAGQLAVLDGTPLKGLAWRLLGVKIGKRVFDDGCGIVEKSMVSIGDGCTLNMRSIVEPHSQEDGGFKSDRIEIGSGCTLGTGSWVHYGTKLGDGVEIAPDAFLMKGQEAAPNTRWAENPAREVSR
jgi:non-ribosomal peptide synthetase-like protein